MLLTQETKEAATHLVENSPVQPAAITPLPAATKQRLLNSTVKLAGSSPSGKGFIGSAVIFNVNNNAVTLLTALHNAMIWFENGDGWIDQLDTFATKIKIMYNAGNQTFNGTTGATAPLKTAAQAGGAPCGQRGSCLYDAMVLTSTDSNLIKYAKASVFGGAVDTIKTEGPTIVKSFESMLDPSAYYYVQLGFGDIKDPRQGEKLDKSGKIVKLKVMLKKCGDGFTVAANNLQYRLANPSFKETNSHYQQDSDTGAAPSYTEFAEAISLSGKVFSTTAPGDSGGPLYAVDRATMKNVYLLGVTTGADMEASKKPNLHAFKNVISTSIVPYLSSLK